MSMQNLIYKYLSNTANEEEIAILFEWIDASPKNKSLFLKLKKAWVLTATNNGKRADWIEIQNKIRQLTTNELKDEALQNNNKIHLLKGYKNFPLFAACAVLVLILTISFFNSNQSSTVIEVPKIVNTNSKIKIGTDKAILTLEDGSTIALEKGQDYIADNLTSNGEELVYKSKANNTKPEIVYNYLTIPRGGQFFVKLEDGTQVWLNSESQLKYPKNFIKGKTRQVELVYGEAYFDVSPSENHHGATFKILTENQAIEVIGTEFNIKAYHDEALIYTTLIEGKIVLDNTVQKKELKPNQQSILSKETKNIEVKEVNVAPEIAWRNGVFSFKKKSLKEIMKVLSRWYNVDIQILNEELETVKYIGVLNKSQNLEEILSIIKNTKFINAYEIKNDTIIIK